MIWFRLSILVLFLFVAQVSAKPPTSESRSFSSNAARVDQEKTHQPKTYHQRGRRRPEGLKKTRKEIDRNSGIRRKALGKRRGERIAEEDKIMYLSPELKSLTAHQILILRRDAMGLGANDPIPEDFIRMPTGVLLKAKEDRQKDQLLGIRESILSAWDAHKTEKMMIDDETPLSVLINKKEPLKQVGVAKGRGKSQAKLSILEEKAITKSKVKDPAGTSMTLRSSARLSSLAKNQENPAPTSVVSPHYNGFGGEGSSSSKQASRGKPASFFDLNLPPTEEWM